MATADEIPTDLALEIGADFEPKKFLAVARAFFGLVERVTNFADAGQRLEWHVKVREGSNIIALAPVPTALSSETTAAYGRMEAATKALAAGDLGAATLDDGALDFAKKLSELTRSDSGPVPMRIWVRREPILFGSEIAEFIREEARAAYWDFGTLEGTLNAIQDASGSLELKVRDPLWSRAIKCLVSEAMLPLAMENFRNRVELGGEIQYRPNGTPFCIRVERLERIPDDSELPSIDDVRGLLADDPA